MSQQFRFGCVLLLWPVVMSGCGGGLVGYRQTVQSGSTTLPIAVEMEKLFGPADHFIVEYSIKKTQPHEWHTKVYFGDRYELTMVVTIRIDYGKHKFAVIGKPQFYLHEVESVTVSPNGVASTSFSDQLIFSEEEWKRVYKAKGDFSSIGFKINATPVVDFEAFKQAQSGGQEFFSLVEKR